MGKLSAVGRQLYEGCLAGLRVVFVWFEGCLSTSVCGIEPASISPHGAGSGLTVSLKIKPGIWQEACFLCIAAVDAQAHIEFQQCWEQRSCLVWDRWNSLLWLEQGSPTMCCRLVF